MENNNNEEIIVENIFYAIGGLKVRSYNGLETWSHDLTGPSGIENCSSIPRYLFDALKRYNEDPKWGGGR